MPDRGFILQPSYRIESGRPVVYLYGKLESGETFLICDHREVPHFFLRRADADRARAVYPGRLTDTGEVSLRGEPLLRVEVRTPQDTPPLRDRLIAAGVPCYEADIRFPMRCLIDRGIRSALIIDGPYRPGQGATAGIHRVYDDPCLLPTRFAPELSVLSFDIETDPTAQHLLSIALYGAGAKTRAGAEAATEGEVLLLCPRGATCPAPARLFSSQRDLLVAFAERVRALDPDVITGWNVIDFDLAVLSRLAEAHGVPLSLGRGAGSLRIQSAPSGYSGSRATVPGRVILDGIALLRGSFITMEEYSLDFVSREVLGEGKIIGNDIRGPGGKAGEILRLFRHDRERFVAYNLTDARLAWQILSKLHLIELAVERSLLTGMPPDRVSASIASFDFLYLSELRRRGVVAPSVIYHDEGQAPEGTMGGHVLQPEAGLYKNVVTFDFKSLYPSVIRTFQIDPLGHLPGWGTLRQKPIDAIVAPGGAAFRREPSILTGLLDDLFPAREAAKAAGESVKSHAIKILMNSFYGVLGTSACRFHSPEIANAITGFGKEILLWVKARIEAAGHRVIYGDTDSLFVVLRGDNDDPRRTQVLGEELLVSLNRDLTDHIRHTWHVQSKLELEYDTLYLRLLLPLMRGGGAGARKRYAGLVEEKGRQKVVFTGMEVVRRDWTHLARQVQRELYERLFTDRPVDAYLRQVVADLRAGRYDNLLVYRKALRKDLSAYTAITPPHVAAARKMSEPGGRLISYVMTTAGPEPADESQSPLDHEHYVQKQVRPVAEPMLTLLHLNFDKVIGDNRQLELFG